MKDTTWVDDKRFSDAFIPEIKSILGLYLIGEAPTLDDTHKNTDLIVLKMEAVRIGCRIRRHEYLQQYGDQFTIRSERASGTKTELAKIVAGWGDYFFYGFSDPNGVRLSRWMLGDLYVFRQWFTCMIARNGGNVPGTERQNKDGRSSLRAFQLKYMPDNFLVASNKSDSPPGQLELGLSR